MNKTTNKFSAEVRERAVRMVDEHRADYGSETRGPLMVYEPFLDPATINEVIEMALSDTVSFADIQILHGLSHDAVKTLMRRELKPGSYRAWRKRVRQFSDRRESYK